MTRQPGRQLRQSRILLSSVAAFCLISSAAAAQTPTPTPTPIQLPAPTEYPVDTLFSGPVGITVGPDAAIWFTQPNATHVVGRITPAGLPITYFPASGFPDTPTGAIAASSTSLFLGANKSILVMDTNGVPQTPYHLPDQSQFHQIDSIAWDGASAVWFTDFIIATNSRGYGKLNLSSGIVTENSLASGDPCAATVGGRRNMTKGPDGAMWFTAIAAVCRINFDGSLTPQAIPADGDPSPQGGGEGIATGPDGRIWVGQYAGTIGYLKAFTPGPDCPGSISSCHIDTFPLPTPPARHIHGVTAGPDGRIWFVTENDTQLAGSVKTDGTGFEFSPLPSASSLPISIVAGPPGDNSVWFTEVNGRRIGRVTGLAPSTALLLQGGRFKVEVTWAVPPQGTSGDGKAAPIAPDTGAFWFFTPNNYELMIKVLDGTAINGHWWVFFGALSNVEYTITVTDLSTGAVWTYHNPFGTLASDFDTSAFATVEPPPLQARSATQGARLPFGGFDPVDLVRAELASPPAASPEAAPIPCTPDATSLCLTASRFKVQVAWNVPSQGRSGVGTAAALTADTGDFWFFSSNNLELIIKVLDARGVNNHFWVFYGALSNVEYTITITDTQTGTVKTYFNPSGTLASVADTAAF